MTVQDYRRDQQWARALISVIVLCLAALLFAVISQTYRQVFRPPPFTFGQEVYLPADTQICPGDTMSWNYKLIVNRAPTMLAVGLTLWDVSKQTTIEPDQQLDFLIWTHEEQGETLVRPARFTLPDNLPVGLYEVRGAATAFNSDSAAYRVPFVIPETCFKKEPT